jgi:2-amino-4-hydroxy-6-hydroxymethyldihydropteridine diphosphokinase
MTDITFLAFGSNIGDGKNMINNAIARLKEGGCDLLLLSSFYITKPMINGIYTEPTAHMPAFTNCLGIFALNQALISNPQDLLLLAKNTETSLGRLQRPKWSEREIDIDIIFYNDITLATQSLTVPHPEYLNRSFVTQPLSELKALMQSFNAGTHTSKICNILSRFASNTISNF